MLERERQFTPPVGMLTDGAGEVRLLDDAEHISACAIMIAAGVRAR
jgi:hypothetical protein